MSRTRYLKEYSFARWLDRMARRLRVNQALALAMAALAGVSWAGAMVPVAQRIPTLEFRLVDDQNNPCQAQQSGEVPTGDMLYQLQNGSAILLKRDLVVTGDEVAEAIAMTAPDGPAVYFRLNARGAASMLTTTQQNLGHRLAVVYNDRVISVAMIRGVFGPKFEVSQLTTAEARAISMQFGAAAGHSSH